MIAAGRFRFLGVWFALSLSKGVLLVSAFKEESQAFDKLGPNG